MQTILIAGGAGFIGSHFCKELAGSYKVICLDNLITGDKKNIDELLDNSRFQFIECDITRDLSSCLSGLESIDYICHLASPASPNKNSPRSYIQHPLETLLANSLGTHNLLEISRIKNAVFLYASSSEVYGDPLQSPQKESYFGNVNPNGPRSVYDEGKRFGEAMVMAYVRKFNIDARIVRIFNTYGANMQKDDGRVISNFINQAINNQDITIYGDGTQTRSFCYIDDMVAGLIELMFKENLKGHVFNLGNPSEKTIQETAQMIKNMTDSNSKIVYADLPQDDPKRRNPDISKAEKLLNWHPEVALSEGLKKTIAYFKSAK